MDSYLSELDEFIEDFDLGNEEWREEYDEVMGEDFSDL